MLVALPICLQPALVTAAPPHLVQLVVDDLGTADHSVFDDHAEILTPTLRKLADDGVRLSNYYVQPVCSPTRSALLTGRYPFRDGMQHEATILPSSKAHLPLSTKTAAELLSSRGYEAHAIGKWHLGYASWKYTPLNRGFHSFVGYMQGMTDYYNKTVAIAAVGGGIRGFDFWRGNSSSAIAPEMEAFHESVGTYSLEQYRDAFHTVIGGFAARQAAQRAVGMPAAKALYLYLAMQTVHIPLEARTTVADPRCARPRISDYWRQIYCSMLVEMDDALDEFVQAMRKAQLYDNTLLLMTTDNGGMVRFAVDGQGKPDFAASAGDNYPLRGSKGTLFEGGVRGTAFVSGGLFPTGCRGRTFDGLMSHVDLAATMLAVAGVKLAKIQPTIDGIDHWAALTSTALDAAASTGTGGSTRGSAQLRGMSRSLRDHVPVNIVRRGEDYTAVVFHWASNATNGVNATFKLIMGTPLGPFKRLGPVIGGWYRGGKYPAVDPAPAEGADTLLFDLSRDPQERAPLPLKEHAAAHQHGLKLIKSYTASSTYREPQTNRPHVAALPGLHGGAWSPWLRDEAVGPVTLEEVEEAAAAEVEGVGAYASFSDEAALEMLAFL